MEATLWQRLDEIITRTVRPMAERCDEESLFCGESVRALADAGFMGLPYPPEQGGRGSSYESYVRCVERLSKVCPSVGVTYATHVGLACHPLHAFGSPMQKESFVPCSAATSWGPSRSRSPRPGRTWGPSPPRRSWTAASTSSTDTRYSSPMPAGPISISSLPVPAGRARKA